MKPRRARMLALVALCVLAVLATGCRVGAEVVLWGPCSPGSDPTGTDGEYSMVCDGGMWTPIMTVDEFVRSARGEDVVIAPLPKRPAPTTTSVPVASTVPPTTVPVTTTVPPTTTTVPGSSVSSMSPDRGSSGGGTLVTITGVGLGDVRFVAVGGYWVVPNTIFPTSITFDTPPRTAGLHDVELVFSNSPAISAGSFSFGDAPTITSISPRSVEQNSSERVDVTGTNLTDIVSITLESAFLDSQRATYPVAGGSNANFTMVFRFAGPHDLTIVTAYGSVVVEDAIYVIPRS